MLTGPFFQRDQHFSDEIVRTEFVVGKNTGMDWFSETIVYKSDLTWWIALIQSVCSEVWVHFKEVNQTTAKSNICASELTANW